MPRTRNLAGSLQGTFRSGAIRDPFLALPFKKSFFCVAGGGSSANQGGLRRTLTAQRVGRRRIDLLYARSVRPDAIAACRKY